MTRIIDTVRHGTSIMMEYRDASVVIIDALHTALCHQIWRVPPFNTIQGSSNASRGMACPV